jgi:hypothetical protein
MIETPQDIVENFKTGLDTTVKIVHLVVIPFMFYMGMAIIDLKESMSSINVKLESIADIKTQQNKMQQDYEKMQRSVGEFYKEYGQALEWAKQQSKKDN